MSSKLWQPTDPIKSLPVPIRRKNTIPGTWLTLTPSITTTNNNTNNNTANTEAVSPTLDPQRAVSPFLTNDSSISSASSTTSGFSRHSSFSSSTGRSSFSSLTAVDMRGPLKSNWKAALGIDAAERREANAALGRKIVEE